MLTLHEINNAQYYLAIDSEDYYLDSHNEHSFWCGFGSRHLDLAGARVTKEPYSQIMNGFDADGDRLVQNAGSENRRIGWDLTFSAPKSVSLLWAAGCATTKEAILAAHHSAVLKAVDIIEREAAVTRRGKGSKQFQSTAGLTVASFTHFSNRELEPHLHNHCIIFNAAPRSDGTWGSIESRKLYLYRNAIGACYRAELSHQLQALGYSIEAEDEYFHLKGVPKALCKQYSKRAEQINSYNAQFGFDFKAAEKTRKVKKPETENTFFEWKNAINKAGLTEELTQSIRANKLQQAHITQVDTDAVIYELTSKCSIFHKHDLLKQVAIEASHLGLNANAVLDLYEQALDSPNILQVSRTNSLNSVYTTQESLDTDRLMLVTAKELQRRKSNSFSNSLVQTAIEKSQKKLSLQFNEEQLDAIHYIISSGDLCITQGSAGAGKTTMLRAVKSAYQDHGLTIRGASVAKLAADNLQAETDIESSTIHSLITRIHDKKQPLKNVDALVIDEAGLIASNDMLLLLQEGLSSQCKIILTGEDRQLDAIKQGGALRFLSRAENIGTYRVEEVRRQRTAWARQVVMDLRDGKSSIAMNSLEERGCLHWHSSSTEMKEALIKDWYAYQTANPTKKSLVLARSWKSVNELNEIIGSIHVSEGQVGTEDVPLKCSVANYSFEYLYSAGDRIKFCQNDYRKLQVTNGTTGTVKQVREIDNDVSFLIETDDGRQLSFLASDYADENGSFLCHAYALTIFSSQGVTVDGNTYTLFSPDMDRASTYVALSRHKDESHLYVSSNSLHINGLTLKEHMDMEQNADIRMLRHEALAKITREDSYSKLAIEWLAHQEVKRELELSSEM